MCAAIFLQMVLASGVSADGPATASAPSPAAALKAVQATLTLIPAHDIEHDYRPVQISVADLDGDGTAEIIYVYTSTWTGGTSVQKNELVVMTALGPGDRRGLPAYPGTNRVDDEDHAAVRASGYAAQDSVHLPGALERLEVIDGEIEATFVSAPGSALCFEETSAARGPACPPAGRHRWRWSWRSGVLVRDFRERAAEPLP